MFKGMVALLGFTQGCHFRVDPIETDEVDTFCVSLG
jgi:hypothetical protein